jgi:phosphoribosylanthranilate isomerase
MIKVCGLTRLVDAEQAVRDGATALGFNFWPRSPRYIAPDVAGSIIQALPADVLTVGVFVDESPAQMQAVSDTVGLRAIQLHGSEPPSYADQLHGVIIKALGTGSVDAASAWPSTTLILLDAVDSTARGGTGRRVDWAAAAVFARERRVILAGGLTPENVAEAIETVRPIGVDVSSGVEVAPGIKDADKVRRFVTEARGALARLTMGGNVVSPGQPTAGLPLEQDRGRV